MSYTTLTYIIFLAIVGIIYYCAPKKAQWVVLLVASLAFFIANSEALVGYLIATSLVAYICALVIQHIGDKFQEKRKSLEKAERKIQKQTTKKKQKSVLTIGVVISIGMLGALKYCNFFGDIVNSIASVFSAGKPIPTFSILLPIGISYYTLMLVSYMVDVFRGTIKAEKNYFRLLLFASYFPHIMEGPFDRYDKLDAQFRQAHSLDYDVVKSGALLVMYGLFKKLVIADRAGIIVGGIFDRADNASAITIFIGTMLYTLQLYADFSGCIDIVSGTSEMFGIKLSENFKQPFFSKSINEFWRRWHITLGLWLKDYVFYPVSLSNGFKKVNSFAREHLKSQNLVRMVPAAYALFFVWFCNGIWHGASGKYIFYGLYYYILMMIGEFSKPLTDKLCTKIKLNRDTKSFGIFQIIRTFLIVNFGMLIFRSNDIGEAFGYFKWIGKGFRPLEMFGQDFVIDGITNYDYLIIIVGICVLFTIGLLKEKGHSIRLELSQRPLVLRWCIYLVLIYGTMIFGAYGGNFSNAGMIYAEF